MGVSASYFDDLYKKKKDAVKYRCNLKMSLLYDTFSRIVKFIPKNRTIAELGCRDGYFAKMCIDEKLKYSIGVDFSYEAIIRASAINRGYENCFFTGDVTDKLSLQKAFGGDIVVSINILQYLENDLELISLIPRKKKFIFSVPNYNDGLFVRCFEKPHDVEDRFVRCLGALHYVGEAVIGDSNTKKSLIFEAIK